MLDNVPKVASIVYLALTIVGLFKQAIYYRIFGINIFDYLQLSEVLVLSINDITLYISILVIVIVILFVLDKSSNQFEEENLLAIYNKPFYLRHISFRNKLAWSMFLMLIYFNGAFIFFPKTRTYWAVIAIDIACFVFYSYLVIIVEVARSYYQNNKENKTKLVTLAQILGMFLFLLIVFTTHKGLGIILAKHKHPDVELYTETIDKPIQGSYLFIGKTDKYLFVYDYEKHISVIYSSDFVKKISLL